jgi:SAM-dependent methyltransferase
MIRGMSAQYDGVAGQYSTTEEMPLRTFVEVPRVLEQLGELRGKSVLDLACGSGLLTRLFRQRGAARVVGADISEDMIRIARQQASAAGLGIEYLVHDAGRAPLGGDFDLVSAVWLLHYAGQAEALARMCQNVHDSLKPGGHLVALVPNPEFSVQPPNYARYGITVRLDERVGEDLQRVSLEFHTQPPFTVRTHAWSMNAYHRALWRAGFRNISWRFAEPIPEGVSRHGADYWSFLLDSPHAIVLRGERVG